MARVRKPGRRSSAELENELRIARAQEAYMRSGLEADALRQAQEETESSRDRYAQLYDFAPFGHVTLDRAGIIRSMNLTAAGLVGHSRTSLKGLPFRTIVAARDRRPFLQYLGRLRRGLAPEPIEIELRHRDGQFVAVHFACVARTQRSQGARHFQAALVDITARKRAEARTLALSRLGLLLGAAAAPVDAARAIMDTALEFCGWDASFVVIRDPQSDQCVDLLKIDTVKGRRVEVEEGSPYAPATPLIRKVMNEGPQLILLKSQDDPAPTTVRFGDTSRHSLSLMFVPIRLEGVSVGVLSVQSYERNAYTRHDLETLQALADHVGGALARLEARDALRRANQELEWRVLERTRQLQEYRDHLEDLVRERTGDLERTNEQLRQEIEHRKTAEQALLRLAQELKRSNLDLERFAYVASHDLQEPLRAVGGYVRLLEHRFPEKVDPKAREYIAGAADGAVRMERLINDLLALSRISTVGLKVAPTDLAVPLKHALRNLQFQIRNARATVTHDALPTLPVDETQIMQLFQNLIANALKFHSEAPIEVRISAREEAERWVISVRDNGIGIAPEYSQRIFQIFQRLHTRTKYPGTGVGLAVCKRIAERHGGDIWVESQPGQGATFCFALPKAQVG